MEIQQFISQLSEQEEALRQADCRLATETTKNTHLTSQIEEANHRLRESQNAAMKTEEQLHLVQAQRDNLAKLNEEIKRDLRMRQEELERMSNFLKEERKRMDKFKKDMTETVEKCNQRMRVALGESAKIEGKEEKFIPMPL